jgi:hypothetical protein
MHPERVVIARISAVVAIAAVDVAVVVAAAIRSFGSLLLGHLFPIIQVIVFLSRGCPRARATIIRIILPLHSSDALRPSNTSRDLLLLDGIARCDRSGRDTPSATDAGGPLDLHG